MHDRTDSVFTDNKSLVPEYLRERLLEERDSVSVQFGGSARSVGSTDFESDAEELGRQGKPYFRRGGGLGSTSRIVSVDRKTWNLFAARSLGRTESCEFSSLDQENYRTDKSVLAKRLTRTRHRQTVLQSPQGHRSIFGLPVISPFNRYAKGWLSFIAILDMTFTAFLVPYITAFLTRGGRTEDIMVWIIDVVTGSIFMFDVFAKFHIGFVVRCDYRTKVELRGKHVAWYYFHHGGAWIDMMSILPSVIGILVFMLGSLTKQAPVHLIRYVRMIRIVRLTRTLAQSGSLMSTESRLFHLLGPAALHLLTVVYSLIVLVNFLGCLLYFVAEMEDSDLKDTWISKYDLTAIGKGDGYHYLMGVYWAITTVTTVGYGDVTPSTWIELLLMGVIMLTQIIIFGLLIGTMTEVVTNSMTHLRQAETYKTKMQSVGTWLMHYEIPQELVDDVKSFYSHVWVRKQEVEESQILDELPFRVRSRIVFSLIGEKLENLAVFRFLKRNTVFKIASKMKPNIKYPEEVIAYPDKDSDALYFLEDGTASIATNRGVMFYHSAPAVFGVGTILSQATSYNPCLRPLFYRRAYAWRLKAHSCCRVWRVETSEVFEVVEAEDGPDCLLQGFQKSVLEQLDEQLDERAQQRMLGRILGWNPSAGMFIQLKQELMTDGFDCERFVRLLQTIDRAAASKEEIIACPTSFQILRIRLKGDVCVDDGRVSASLKSRGYHGAVEFVGKLVILGDKCITENILASLIASVGINDKKQALSSSLLRCKNKGRLQISLLIEKLAPSQLAAEVRPAVEEVFLHVFSKKGEADMGTFFKVFNGDRHPDVESGIKSKAQVTQETFAIIFKQDFFNLDNFVIYHQLVALCCPNEESFHEYLECVWNHNAIMS